MTFPTHNKQLSLYLNTEIGKTTLLENYKQGANSVQNELGGFGKVAVIASTVLSTATFISLVSLSGYGAAQLFSMGVEALKNGEELRSDSTVHGGEWTSQIIFYCLVYCQELGNVMGEGNYKNIRTLSESFLKENGLNEDSQRSTEIYNSVLEYFRYASKKTLFHKSPLEERLATLDLMKTSKSDLRSHAKGHLLQDLMLEKTYLDVHETLKNKTRLGNYPERFREALSFISKEKGTILQVASVTAGIAIPIILTVLAGLSFVGAYQAAEEVLHEKAEQFVWGHVGECPANGIAFLYMAKFIHNWVLMKEGDFSLVKKLYKKKLSEKDPSYEESKRLKDLFEEDLERRAHSLAFDLRPINWQLEFSSKESSRV